MEINSDEFLWTEKYRPRKVSDCILPDRIKKTFQNYVDSAEIPNLMLSGTAGTGKTTIAKAMCEEADINYLFINSSKDRGIDTLRTKISQYASTMSLTGGRKVIILDEADGLTPDAQNALRGAIEEYSKTCTFILTCNFKAKLIDALHSRMATIDFKAQGNEKIEMQAAFFKRLGEILTTENIKFDKNVLGKIVAKFYPDFRKTVGELQRYVKEYGEIDATVLGSVNEIRNITELAKYLKDKDFSNMRKWVAGNTDIDPAFIYRKIYDSLYQYLEPSSIPQAVVTIAKYQYQSAFVADQEISFVACMTEIMIDCTFQ